MNTISLRNLSSLKRLTLAVTVAVAGATVVPVSALAQTIGQPSLDFPSGVLTLDAAASTEVPADVVRIDMFFEQQGNDPTQLTQALNQRTEAALKIARQQEGVKVKTGSFSIAPSTDRDGKISTWRGRSEIELESHDFAAASRLAGQLGGTLQIGGVSFSLSPEAQHEVEAGLTKQAIASFRQQAQAAAQAFGYTGYTIREVNVGRNGASRSPRIAYRAMGLAASAKTDALPMEAGTTTVTVSVNGAVQMTR